MKTTDLPLAVYHEMDLETVYGSPNAQTREILIFRIASSKTPPDLTQFGQSTLAKQKSVVPVLSPC